LKFSCLPCLLFACSQPKLSISDEKLIVDDNPSFSLSTKEGHEVETIFKNANSGTGVVA
jgi:hypothetical protein